MKSSLTTDIIFYKACVPYHKSIVIARESFTKIALTLAGVCGNVSAYLQSSMKQTNTKERLLQSTLKLISEKGYLGATTKDIASAAGVTELTLFRNFGSKERLFEELLQNYTFLPKLKELLPELDELAVDEALALVATRFLLSLKERKSMVKIMYSEVTIYPEKIKTVYNRFLADIRSTLATYFRSLQNRGAISRDVPAETAARVYLWILFSYFRSEEILRSGGMKKAAMERDVREIVRIFLQGTIARNT